MNLKVVLILLSLLKIASSSFDLKPFEDEEVVDATHMLIDQAIKRHASINVITAVKNEFDGKVLDYKLSIIVKCKPGYAYIYHNHTGIRTGPKRKKRNTIFILDTIDIFRKFHSEVVSTKFDFNGHFIFVLIDGFINEIEEIFKIMWEKNIYNVNVVYKTDNGTIIETFLPFESTGKNCGSTKPKIINKYRKGKLEGSMLFPQKFKSFQNCPIRVVTFEDEDVVMRTGNDEYSGYCIDLLMALAKQLNFQPDIKYLTGDYAQGVVHQNGTSTGALGEVYNKRSDVALGDFFLKPNLILKLDHTATYQVMDLVWIIPPGPFYSPSEKLRQPLSLTVWILTGIVIAVGLLVILLINLKFPHLKPLFYGENVKNPFINMLIIIFGSSQTQMPTKTFARLLIMNFLLFCLVLRSVYQGFLFEFLQSDGRHKEVQSIDEMIEKGFTFYASESSTLDLVKGSMEIYNRTKKYENENFLLHTELSGSEKIAGLETVKNVINANQGNKTVIYCKDTFMYINIVLYLPKDSYITRIFNENIVKLIASGLVKHWIAMHHFDKVLKNDEKRKDKTQKKLNLHRLSGAFYILFLGYGLATIFFIFEYLNGILKARLEKFMIEVLISSV